MATLAALGLVKYFQQGAEILEVLRDITVLFEQGKTYAITGASGSGKSTLIHLLAGLDEPSQGAIYFNGADIALFDEFERAQFLNRSVGFVFQLPYLIRELSVIENIMLPGLIGGELRQNCGPQAEYLLDRVGLADKAQSKPAALSGGQQQRVVLARALFNRPAFLIADEPTGNLDVSTGKSIVELIVSLQREWAMGVILSTHDTYVADRMALCYELKEGNLIAVRS